MHRQTLRQTQAIGPFQATDVTYYNHSQALVQGDVIVYGTLIVQDVRMSMLWGADLCHGDRRCRHPQWGPTHYHQFSIRFLRRFLRWDGRYRRRFYYSGRK